MTPRQRLKYWFYGARGSFPYFGVNVYFPPRSIAFRAACLHGIFEASNVRILGGVCVPGSVVFDVGANLGLISIPILRTVIGCTVVSFEPSPNSLPFLRRTIDGSGLGDRWCLVESAVGAMPHRAEFSLSRPDEGLFDGLRSTGIVSEFGKVSVDVTTLDDEWKRRGCPPVSAIKIDVEGAELDVIRGARECLTESRPAILIEWNAGHLEVYGINPNQILETSREFCYQIYALPSLVQIETKAQLKLHMIGTESFLLVPENNSERNTA